ncbi:MAG: mobile mystery protein B [Stellaceae bacterium]
MFDKVWKWAGQFRRSDKNIGCEWTEIPILLKILLDDARYWIANKTFDPDETVMRFHFRLVHKIHGFPNGNGRHARLMADLLITKVDRSRFTWGSQSLKRPGIVRQNYLDALRAADRDENFDPLLRFARE